MESPPEPEVPSVVEHVWHWFWTLNRQRRKGPEALTYADVDAWSRLMQITVSPDEVQMLMAMDLSWMKAAGEEMRAFQERQHAEAVQKKSKRR